MLFRSAEFCTTSPRSQLLERIRGDLGEVVQNSADWVKDLDRIAEAAAETARAGKRVADVGRQSAELAARITQTLGKARTAGLVACAKRAILAAVRAQWKTNSARTSLPDLAQTELQG